MGGTRCADAGHGRWIALAVLAVGQVGGMSTWFSAAAVAPSLARDWSLTPAEIGALTVATQLGFVAGALGSAIVGIADIFPARLVFVVAALCAALLNAAIAVTGPAIAVALLLRFALGAVLAGIYPVGMKLMANWFQSGRGMAIGTLVGALTLGSAAPHLLAAAGDELAPWRIVVAATSLASAAAALLVLVGLRDGPFATRAPRFDMRWAASSLSDPAVRLANLGYLGHMWELYAMWTWLPLFLISSFTASGASEAGPTGSLVAGIAIGAGGLACVVAGVVADRVGRTAVTAGAMAVSGTSAVVAGLAFGAHPLLVSSVAVVWGLSVIADSAQFSVAISELSPSERVGSALALQTAMGFLLTAVSIQILPPLVGLGGWSLAFGVLAVGPAIGVAAMLRLRARPESLRLAGGHR